jgi:hypothetical protein
VATGGLNRRVRDNINVQSWHLTGAQVISSESFWCLSFVSKSRCISLIWVAKQHNIIDFDGHCDHASEACPHKFTAHKRVAPHSLTALEHIPGIWEGSRGQFGVEHTIWLSGSVSVVLVQEVPTPS